MWTLAWNNQPDLAARAHYAPDLPQDIGGVLGMLDCMKADYHIDRVAFQFLKAFDYPDALGPSNRSCFGADLDSRSRCGCKA